MPKIQIENVLQPGKTYNVDAEKFEAVRAVYLSVMPDATPGLTPAEIRARMTPLLPQALFPGGEKAGWWAKAVQLDLEAKKIIARSEKAPVTLWRVGQTICKT